MRIDSVPCHGYGEMSSYQSSRNCVRPNKRGRKTYSSSHGHFQEIRYNSAHPHQVTSKQTNETDNGTDRNQDFNNLSISFSEDIRQSQCEVVINLACKENGI